MARFACGLFDRCARPACIGLLPVIWALVAYSLMSSTTPQAMVVGMYATQESCLAHAVNTPDAKIAYVCNKIGD